MNLDGIYQSDQAIIKFLNINVIPDHFGFELCENWNEIKKLISINWKYYISSPRESLEEISEIKNFVELQLLIDWICSQYLYYKSLSNQEIMLIEDKIIGILDPNLEVNLNRIINNSPPIPSSLVVQIPDVLSGGLPHSIISNIDPSKTFAKLKDKKLSFLQLEKGTNCLITFPTLDIILPKDIKIHYVETKPINFIFGDQNMEINTGFYINLIDLELILKFCENLDIEIYNLFSDEIKNLWKTICKWCIKNGKGDLELSKKILNLEK